MPVRSKRLASGQATSGTFTTIYTVPSGRRTIVRSLNLIHADTGSVGAQYLIRISGTDYSVWAGTLGASGRIVIDHWHVIEAGESMRLYCDGSWLFYHASGAELVL